MLRSQTQQAKKAPDNPFNTSSDEIKKMTVDEHIALLNKRIEYYTQQISDLQDEKRRRTGALKRARGRRSRNISKVSPKNFLLQLLRERIKAELAAIKSIKQVIEVYMIRAWEVTTSRDTLLRKLEDDAMSDTIEVVSC